MKGIRPGRGRTTQADLSRICILQQGRSQVVARVQALMLVIPFLPLASAVGDADCSHDIHLELIHQYLPGIDLDGAIIQFDRKLDRLLISR